MDREPGILCNELENILYIDNSIRELNIHVAYSMSWFKDKPKSDLRDEIGELVRFLREKYSVEELKNHPIIRAYRDFYWRIGIDPTKTRPSSEALIRRVLRGRGFPSINPVVDAGNIASAYTFVPIGLYDLAKINLPLKLTMSKGGELFKPIGGGDEVLKPNTPILIDSKGVVLHLYPHRDSRETCITGETHEILVIGAGVPGVSTRLVREAVSKVLFFLEKINGSSCNRIVVKQ